MLEGANTRFTMLRPRDLGLGCTTCWEYWHCVEACLFSVRLTLLSLIDAKNGSSARKEAPNDQPAPPHYGSANVLREVTLYGGCSRDMQMLT
jgi:hypothetical protein